MHSVIMGFIQKRYNPQKKHRKIIRKIVIDTLNYINDNKNEDYIPSDKYMVFVFIGIMYERYHWEKLNGIVGSVDFSTELLWQQEKKTKHYLKS